MDGVPKNKQLLLLGIVAGVLLLFLFGSITNSKNRQNNTATEYLPTNSPALITGAETLYKTIGNDRQYNALKDDITKFGVLAIPEYQTSSTSGIEFEVTGKITHTRKGLSFTGNYKKNKDPIKVTVDVLGMDRIKTSIYNSRNEGIIDSRLPSNTKENQFISKLPYTNKLFKVEYNSSVSAYVVTGLSPAADVRQQATAYITDGTGKDKGAFKMLFKPFLF
ncbi:hypothetical protein BH10PAT3_BH10PAT3_1770 [soil metagenome]